MVSSRRGQAALEFLTTYGWAFLVILVMIGGLSYFGVLNVSNFVPDRCKLDGNLECPSYKLTGTTTPALQLEIQNNVAETVKVLDVEIKEKNVDAWCNITTMTSPDISRGDKAVVKGNLNNLGSGCNVSNNIDNKKTFDLRVYYKKGNSEIDSLAAGSLTTTVR